MPNLWEQSITAGTIRTVFIKISGAHSSVCKMSFQLSVSHRLDLF